MRNILLVAWGVLGSSPVMAAPEGGLSPGLVWVFFNDVAMQRPADLGVDEQINLDTGTEIHDYARVWLGWIQAPTAGEVTFIAEADDGLRLRIGGKIVIDGWSRDVREGRFAFARKEERLPFALAFFQNGGAAHVRLSWRWPGQPQELVPAAAFGHTEEEARQAQALREGKLKVEEWFPLETKAEIYVPGTRPAATVPIHLGPGPHLFLDEFLIESSENLTRRVNRPQRDPAIPNPLVTGKEDGCFQPYMTVLRDPDSGRFRLWYGHRVEDFHAGASHLGYLESEDGIHWLRPPRVLQDPAPIQFGVSILDEGRDYPDASRRFKYGWWKDGGLQVAASPDGLTWTPLAPGVVLPHNHDINSLFYDPLRERYVATISVYETGNTWSGQRRVTLQSFSQDLLAWETPHYVLTPDDRLDEGETQFYAMDGFLVRGDLIIGMVKVLRDDLKADDPPDPPEQYGIGYTTLAWTRDGETWVRDREVFFDRHPAKGVWDHAHAWIDEQVLVGDEVYLYYGGYARGHKVNRFEERQIGLVRMKRDRYVSRAAGATPGTLRTPLVTFEATGLTLNAQVDGEIRVRLLDAEGHPLPGFDWDDCDPIRGDSLAHRVSWKGSLATLRGRAVRLEFALREAELYGFEWVPAYLRSSCVTRSCAMGGFSLSGKPDSEDGLGGG